MGKEWAVEHVSLNMTMTSGTPCIPPVGSPLTLIWLMFVGRANHEDGWEKEGSALAVYHRGQLVVDLWGGWADRAAGRVWEADNMAVAWSSTKVSPPWIISPTLGHPTRQ